MYLDAISHWDELTRKWRVEVGDWQLRVGINAGQMVMSTSFHVAKDMPWVGL